MNIQCSKYEWEEMMLGVFYLLITKMEYQDYLFTSSPNFLEFVTMLDSKGLKQRLMTYYPKMASKQKMDAQKLIEAIMNTKKVGMVV